jgi:threonine dehydrogenase-like Zn-dependent dehydrogenase
MVYSYYSLERPGVLKFLPTPLGTESGGIEIRTLYSAISPGTELAAYGGLPPLRDIPNPYPRLLGYCSLGEVVALEQEDTGIQLGDRVLTHAAHRNGYFAKAAQVLAKIPDNADLVAASTVYLFHLGYDACLRGQVRAGMSVAVVGLGTLGLTTSAVARLFGAAVVGFSNSAVFSEFHQEFGLSAVHPKSVGKGASEFDLVISTTSSWSDWQLALELPRRGGTIAVLGFPGRGEQLPDFNPIASKWFYDKQLRIVACGYTSDLDVPPIDKRFTVKRNCAWLLSEIIAGRLPGRLLVGSVQPAADLDRTYRELLTNRKSGQTVVLDWRGS